MAPPTLVLDEFLPYRLSVASNAVSDRIAQSYRRRFGLKIAEWRLIAILAEQGESTPQALGERTRMDKITVSRAGAALLKRGLLASTRNPQDGRSQLLSLTKEGIGLYQDIAPAALAFERELLRGFTPEEEAGLHALLRRLESAAVAASTS
jgi:DNA-binding MarR family transcriptional regulator